ncbi:MAG: ParB N-terminal domain-containing protein [Patescibacteria group bacterium]
MKSKNQQQGGKATSASAVQTVELRVLAISNDAGERGKVLSQSAGFVGASGFPTDGMFVFRHEVVSSGESLRRRPFQVISCNGPEREVQKGEIVDTDTLRADRSLTYFLVSSGHVMWLYVCDRHPRVEVTKLGLLKGIGCEPPVFSPRFVLQANQMPHAMAVPDPAVVGLGAYTPDAVKKPTERGVWRPELTVTGAEEVDVTDRSVGSDGRSSSGEPDEVVVPIRPAPRLAPPIATAAAVPPPRKPAVPAPMPAPVATPPPETKPVVEKAPPNAMMEKAPRKYRKRRIKRAAVEEADTSVPPPPDVTEALVVPVGKVRPFAPSNDPRFPGQPRVWFDPDKLKKLGLSIRKHGQRTPCMVKRLTPPEDGFDFELIDGERRWRALEMIGATHIAITVSRPKSKADQHMGSLIQNFCREGHTHVEISNAIASQVEVGVSLTNIAAAIGQSVVTVCNLHSLQRLVPELKPLLDPPTPKSDRIRLAEAVELSRIDPARQLEIWEKAKQQPTRGLIRATIKMLGKEFVVHKRTRKVKPSDYSAALERRMMALRLAATNLRQMPQEEVRIAVESLNGQCKAQIAILTELIKSLDEEKRLLYRLGTAARKAAPTASASAPA